MSHFVDASVPLEDTPVTLTAVHVADTVAVATELLVNMQVSVPTTPPEDARDELSISTLGENVSVNIAFVKILDMRAQVYTMVEEKRRDKKRNCQGGYMDTSLGDTDVFDAAAREAFEEIEPIGMDALAWQRRVSQMLRNAYTSRSAELSTEIFYKPMKYENRQFIGVHVSFRLIKLPELWEELGLVVKAQGSMVARELTSNLRWDFLEDIQAQRSLNFSFSITDADINADDAVFVSKIYTDKRIGRVVRGCVSGGCHNTIFDERGQRFCKSCDRARNWKTQRR